MTEPVNNNKWLKPLMKEMGEKIVKGIYISVATDNDYDTQPLEDWLESAILSKLESIEQEAKVDVWQEVDNLALGYRSYRMSDVAQERLRQLKGKG